MKKFVNDPADVVRDALRGVAAAHPELRVDHENRVIVRADGPVPGKVGVVSGGGSGCEPLHTGLVGPGMLDAACPGGDLLLAGAGSDEGGEQLVANAGAGVLHIIKNFTGEIMNFEMAAELAEDDTPVTSNR